RPVSLVQNPPVLFMDHMLPEMDGVETLHQIRSKTRTYFQTVPIVVLTANAIAGSREMFMKEGFSDYVEKPVEPSVLRRVLRRNLSDEKMIFEKGQEDFVQEKQDEDNGLIQILLKGMIDVKKGLLYCGGEEKYLDILQMYEMDGEARLKQLCDTFDEENWKDYTIFVHAIKSSMLSIGAIELSEMAKKLEFAGKHGDVSYIRENHQALKEEFKRVMGVLKSALNKETGRQEENTTEHSEKDVKALDPVLLQQWEERLENAAYELNKQRMLEVLDEIEGSQPLGEKVALKVSEIRRKIEMSDYFSALETFKKLGARGDEIQS
ncbi:MAG: response regulator, partial [Acetatifactor sp.]|nr:response regulator [Acetatifactor sp.]